MSIRLGKPFRAAVERTRASLAGRERALFDYLCAAGQLGYRLPDRDINVRHASGAKDPRKRLAREFAHLRRINGEAWTRASARLAGVLIRQLASPNFREEDRPLRILMAYTTIGLAPDCVVPRDPLARAAWITMVKVFGKIFPSKVKAMGPLALAHRQLATLRREVSIGLKAGRTASGRTAGRAGRALAVHRQLIALVSKALGRKLGAARVARYIFYTKPGDHFWPHPDDPKLPVTVLICVRHDVPGEDFKKSAFVAYANDGSMKRLELEPGSALVVEPGRIHAREPLRAGERVALLSIGLVRARR